MCCGPNKASQCYDYHITPVSLKHLDQMKNIAGFNDAQHRGPRWYDYDSSGTGGSDSDLSGDITDTTSSESTESDSSTSSSDASSVETNEEDRATKVYRTCTPCPYDMLKKYKNLGIKWICAAYQRARRTFKSECMMRYRNCQDGTMGTAVSMFANQTLGEIDNNLKNVETRRKRNKKHDSTSSSSKDKSDSGDKDSLDLSSLDDSATSSEKSKKYGKPKSSLERKGWRKWHRKCTPCPEDMRKKWRDPSIHWICGGYQRARRTFKSLCMMYYRNCQDGTMFVKLHDYRCPDDVSGDHFFYEYRVVLSDETSMVTSDESSEVESSS